MTSFLDDVSVGYDAAIWLGQQADNMAAGDLHIARFYKRTYLLRKKASQHLYDWVWDLQRAHYWAMYIIVLETIK